MGPFQQSGLLRVASNAQLDAAARAAAEQAQQQPVISGLAAYVRQCWYAAKDAKIAIESRMLRNLRNRKGEYDPHKLNEIRKTGGSEIFMMLTSTKCRAAASLIRDVMLGQGSEKPWAITSTPVPDLPPEIEGMVYSRVVNEAVMALDMGVELTPEIVQQKFAEVGEAMLQFMNEQAKRDTEEMEKFMEDQLIEGGFLQAMTAFIDDLTVFPAAILKGPVTRNLPQLAWQQGPDGRSVPGVKVGEKQQWVRVDPFRLFPAPYATNVNDGYLIELHSMTRGALESLIGVRGYDGNAIRAALEDYGRAGHREFLLSDAERESIEQRKTHSNTSPDKLIDAIQFWGSVQGALLIEWGMDPAQVPDPTREYHTEVWQVGRWVIKATLNDNPLGCKPYFKTSYENLPGCFWGNSTADLIVHDQDMCNAAARSLVNNMGIASGPQVYVTVDRLPAGEPITQLFPWKVWQVTSDPTGSTAAPVQFFQPNPLVDELLAVFNHFSVQADEDSGLPRYMYGSANVGGAGRTASGLSMMMGTASKGIKQVVMNIDLDVTTPALEHLHVYDMLYVRDPRVKGDIRIRARGTSLVMEKEALMLRRNEFLAATANPLDAQIVGPEGRAEILREQLRTLEMPVDRVLPRQMPMAAQPMLPAPTGTPPAGNGEVLANGAPVTDNFSPNRMRPGMPMQ